jgi:ABC-2 type transport system permease protein
MVPAMVVFAILSGTLLGLPDPLVAAREAGIFRSYRINGVPALSILIIPALTTVLHVAIASAVITATAPALFQGKAPTDWVGFVVVSLAIAFASTGLGLLIGVVSASSRVTVLWSQLIYLPSMMLGGMMVPLSMLPASLAKVSLVLPASQAMNAYRGLALGETAVANPYYSLIVLVLGGLVALGLSIYLFNWDSRNATRRGHPALALLAVVPYAAGALLMGG